MIARAFFRWGIPTAEAGLEAAQRAKDYGALRDVVMYLPFLLIVGLTFVAASIGIAVVETVALDAVSFALERTSTGHSAPPQSIG